MSSSDGEPSNGPHDYTEGASAIDISDVVRNNRRARKESQFSQNYDDTGVGSMFSGPGHSVNPSSVSRMSNIKAARRSSEWSKGKGRRDSTGPSSSRHSLSRRGSDVSQATSNTNRPDLYDSPSEDEETRSARRRSPSPAPRTSVFSGLAHMFAKAGESSTTRDRRPSMSHRSTASSRRSKLSRQSVASENALDTDDEDEERWGYSSGEEDSVDSAEPLRDDISITVSMQYDSDPPSPHSGFLPVLAFDPLFGDDARIDMDMPPEPDNPAPPGPPSRQTIYIADEDSTIRFIGYETSIWKQRFWRLGCIITVGILGLLGHWFPRLWLRWVAHEKAFKDTKNGFVVVETAHHDITLFPVRKIPYPYSLATVFGPNNTDLGSRPKPNGSGVTNQMLTHLTVVEYRYSKFALDVRTGLWAAIRDWRDESWIRLSAIKDGLDPSTRKQRLTLFGLNEVDIKAKSTAALLVDEVIHPFYVFQIASIILWSLDSYYYYAFCIALISTFSIASTLVETKKTIARMREMSRFSCQVTVFSEGAWIEKVSTDLAPGDVINLSALQASMIPADLFLLSGDAIVNESMLTGESVPVSKIPIKDELLDKWRTSKDVSYEGAKSFLYAGTRVVRIRGSYAEAGSTRPALGLVARTGFDTTKGALIRSMLYPKPMGFKFYRDSIRFIVVLAGIAGLGFCASAVQFVRLGITWHTILLRALDLITVVVPPALPATLTIGTSFALGRLRKRGIFCISPARVNVAGKVNVCCFDKTGTLTEDGLDILGVRGHDRHGNRFGELIENIYDLPMAKEKANFLHALTTCHSLKMVEGVAIGDPLDVKMFEFTKWTLEEGTVGTGNIKDKAGTVVEQTALVQTVVRPPGSAGFKLEDALRSSTRHAHFLELGVIRSFEFVSALRRMSVVVKRLRSNSMEIYVKGAPEVMSEICEKDSFPGDYDDLLSYYTKRGYRVIAIAGKSIEGLSWLRAQKMKREQAESGLRFLGLIIFENKVKPGTAPAIQALRSAHLACRMITGDNPLTAVSVARECRLIPEAAHVFAPVFASGGPDIPRSKLEWSSMDEPSWKLDTYSLKPLSSPHHLGDQDNLEYQDYSLVVTGDVFRWMINHAPLETLQRMLVKAQIFARMSPDEKNEVVERLQSLGYTVLMCGDGANDCAALKAADVGISLSEAEASVAAPFTSSTPDISCVIEVLKEGRAALVTSFSCFKYMALYSLIQFTTITLLYSFASSLGDFQFLYIDLFIIIPVAVTMGRTLPFEYLYHRRPTASLVSKKVLASIIGQIVITSAAQFAVFFWVREQEWYEPPPPTMPTKGDQLEAHNFENTTLFLVSCFQYILVAAVFSIGPPYRKPMWTNGWLMISLIVLTAFNLLVLLSPPKPVSAVLELLSIPFSARLLILGIAVFNVALSSVYERWGAELVSRLIDSLSGLREEKRRVRDGKAYKAIDGGT